ncbi:MAG: class I SAM-dependent methyltransferase [Candidatus Acidiferrales bacterium]
MTSLAPSPTQAGPANAHYNVEYFKWQSEIGRFGGWANLTKFSKYLRPEMRVLDFGCGGGYLLANINCHDKIGIEVSQTARVAADRQGIRVVASTAAVRDDWADLIISNHALEHCSHPLRELEKLFPKLIPGGMLVFVVPCESIRYRRRANDPNHHLYTWSPMSAANLFAEAGFDVLESKAYIHTWPPRFIPRLLRFGGRSLFEAGCRVYGALTYLGLSPAVTSQVRIVAQRPLDS